jgi:hypothetical protein
MRTHEQIIIDAGGPTRLAKLIGIEPGKAKQWRRNSSIPGPYWAALTAAKVAKLDELAHAAAKRTPSKQGEAA